MPIFVHQKVQFSSKILPQIPNFANFVKNRYFCHDGQFSSFRQVFHQKWNPLETSHNTHCSVQQTWPDAIAKCGYILLALSSTPGLLTDYSEVKSDRCYNGPFE